MLNIRVERFTPKQCLMVQKCLLPKEKLPSEIKPGSWVKCHISGTSNSYQRETDDFYKGYAICQVFSRDDITNYCHVDINVFVPTSSIYNKHDQDELYMLNKIECLNHDHFNTLDNVELIIYLNLDMYISNWQIYTQYYLNELIGILLPAYHLFYKCIVNLTAFKHTGIDAIEICTNVPNMFRINEKTCINIKDVRITCPFISSRSMFNALRKQHEDLSDFLQMTKMQRFLPKVFRSHLNLLVIGPTGAGKTCLIEQCLYENKCNVFSTVAIELIVQKACDMDKKLENLFFAAINFEHIFKSKAPTVILIENLDLLCSQIKLGRSEGNTNNLRFTNMLLKLIDDLVKSDVEIICLVSTAYPDDLPDGIQRTGRFDKRIVINYLNEEQRRYVLNELINQSDCLENSEELLTLLVKKTQGYVMSDFVLLINKLARNFSVKHDEPLLKILKECICKDDRVSIMGSDIVISRPTTKMTVIGGMSGIKSYFENVLLKALKRPELFLKFGLSLPKGILLYGPPGCAKTTLAKCLAAEGNMTFISTSAAELYSPYVGCAEKYLMKIFDTARENSPAMIFLDEIDSLIGRRTIDKGSSKEDVQLRILSLLITEMDGIITSPHNGFILIVAATNRPDLIDDALLRPGRFDKLLHVNAPGFTSRVAIFRLQAEKMSFDYNINLPKLAVRTVWYSGADICNLCNEAGLQAFKRNNNTKKIEQQDFNYALKTIKASLGVNAVRWYYKFSKESRTPFPG